MVKTGDANSQRSCSVPQCKSRGSEIALFYFPKDECLRKKWTDAIQIEKRVLPGMQVCSRHFVKNDYIFPDLTNTTKVRRLKKTAVPSQNLPWQFPNKHVSPALAKARMERLKNRQQQRGSATPIQIEAEVIKETEAVKLSLIKDTSSLIDEDEEDPLLKELVKEEIDSDSDDSNVTDNAFYKIIQKPEQKVDNKVSEAKKPVGVSIPDKKGDKLPVVSLSSANKQKTADKKPVIHMRARAPTRLRHRKGVLKCELCGRKCLTPQALRTHQLIAHKNTRSNHSSPEVKSPAAKKPKETPKASPVTLPSDKLRESLSPKVDKEKSLNESAVEKVLQDSDSDTMDTDFSSASELEKEAQQTKPGKKDKIKTEFECPKCRRRFAVYFSAFRHIQKHHPGAQQKSASGLSGTLKPARIEICTLCNFALSGDVHVCGGPLKLAVGFFCTGCNQEFKSLTLFDIHKSGMHSEGVESMFFPTLDEFENWKYRMENQTKVRYTILDQNDTKKIHRCTHLTTFGSGNQTRSRMCPSSIIVQEFAKGFQVHYYPNHFGHNSAAYALSGVFKKYSIASLMSLGTNTANNTSQAKPPQPTQLKSPAQPKNNSEDLIGETDLYLQFKKLTELLINEAAKINVNGLKKITRKVLEIVPIITSYIEDDEDDMSSKLPQKQDTEDLEEQINKAFQTFKKKEPRKRKSVDVDTLLVKRSKPVFQSTENTLKEQRSKAQVRKSAPVVKFKEDKEITVDKKESNRENVKLDIKKEKSLASIQKSFNQSPSFIDQYQEFVGKSMVTKAADKKKAKVEPKKKVVKVKIGQFKPSPPKKVNSPKNTSPKTETNSPSRNSISNVKEIKYEVKEQENDCNILILKI